MDIYDELRPRLASNAQTPLFILSHGVDLYPN